MSGYVLVFVGTECELNHVIRVHSSSRKSYLFLDSYIFYLFFFVSSVLIILINIYSSCLSCLSCSSMFSCTFFSV